MKMLAMKFSPSSTLFVLSNIRGIVDALRKSFPKGECPDIKCISGEEVNELLRTNDDTQLRDSLSSAHYFIADPSILSQVLPFCSVENIKWIHSTWAGPDKMITEIRNMDIPVESLPLMTRAAPSSSPMGWDLGEWCIGQIIARERRFYLAAENAKTGKWDSSQMQNYRSLRQLTIGVMGIGTIGRCIASMAKSLNMNVIAMCRSISTKNRIADYAVDAMYLPKEIECFLGQCDYVINALPSTPATQSMLDGELFKHFKEGSVFMNVGRGDICSELSLIQALDEKWIEGAILDVLPKEPLPSNSPLWYMDNVTITPHVGAVSFSDTVLQSFNEEYNFIRQGLVPSTAVNWDVGY